MVDPAITCFWASWQEVDPGENVDIVGAEAAIEWGRQRSDVVRIRLGDSENTYFSAGDKHVDDLPLWPPEVPPGGWWTPPPGGWRPPVDTTADRFRVTQPSVRRSEPGSTWPEQRHRRPRRH
jgi:hypothetical protein